MESKLIVSANNKKSSKLSWKRRDALVMAGQIFDWFEDKGFILPAHSRKLFGRGFKVSEQMNFQILQQISAELAGSIDNMANYDAYIKANPGGKSYEDFTRGQVKELRDQKVRALRKEFDQHNQEKAVRFFTDRTTGECFYDEYVELARAYYALKESMPAALAIFKSPTAEHYTSQTIGFTCSKHRLDPTYNQVKSYALRALVRNWLHEEQIWERFKPMHLVLTVPHKNGEYMGKKFYAKEMDRQFNFLRKQKFWKKYIHGGIKCFEVTRKGKNGLHVHIHALILQKPQYSRNQVHLELIEAWQKMTGGYMSHYETLYSHKRVDPSNKKSPWILHTDERGNKVWDEARQEWKKEKFYIDEKEPWFAQLSKEEKLEEYTKGVLECIKYHFKYESFRKRSKQGKLLKDEWDIDLIKDILQYSKNMRMYDRFGKLYNDCRLSLHSVERLAIEQTQREAEGQPEEHDGVADKIINPYTKKPAVQGEYVRCLTLPQLQNFRGHQRDYWPAMSNINHDIYFKIKDRLSIKSVLKAVMKKTYADVLIEKEYRRLVDSAFSWRAPRESLWV